MNKKYFEFNRERLLLIALVAVAFFGFLLWSIAETSSEEASLLSGFLKISSPLENKSIKVTAPKIDAYIKSPVTVFGQAAVFEAVLQIKIKDSSGLTLARAKVLTAAGQKMSPFSARVKYKKPSRAKGVVEVFSLSSEDGAEINKITIPVNFKD